VDGDGDGRVDSIFILFGTILTFIPDSITSINWPEEGLDDRTAFAIQISLAGDSLLLIDFENDPFSPGQTSASLVLPPQLTLPAGQILEIEDKVGPILLEAEIIPPDFKRYILESDASGTIRQFPDTLVLRVSESLTALAVPEPWLNILGYDPECSGGEGEIMPVTAAPLVDTGDDKILKIPIWPNALGTKIGEGDCVWLNDSGSYVDAFGNLPSDVQIEVQGIVGGTFDNFYTSLLLPLIGSSNSISNEIVMPPGDGEIPLVDDWGNIVDFVQSGVETDWIPPVYMNEDGLIDERAAENCHPVKDPNPAPRPFPVNCLSAVGVYSDAAYTAQVGIFDNLGKFIQASTQTFGFCGELEDPNRVRPGGYASFLIWNQRDAKGILVGNGVYIIKITYKFQNGNFRTEVFKQGIIRGIEPEPDCAVR